MAKWVSKFDSVAKVECGARESPLDLCPRSPKMEKLVRAFALHQRKPRLRVTFSVRRQSGSKRRKENRPRI